MLRGFGFLKGLGFGGETQDNTPKNVATSQAPAPEPTDFKNDVGLTAGEIYGLLDGKGELFMKDVRSKFANKGILFSAALGWLLREDMIEIKMSETGVAVRLK